MTPWRFFRLPFFNVVIPNRVVRGRPNGLLFSFLLYVVIPSEAAFWPTRALLFFFF
jgi:hypothetical protein